MINLPTIDHAIFWDFLHDSQRAELMDLIGDREVADNTQSVTYDVIDAPLLRLHRYLKDENDDYVVIDGVIQMYDQELPVAALPDWWKPVLA